MGIRYRRYGVDKNFFLLFPLYYESTEDDARTIRVLWPLVTYADSPGRSSLKVWPLIGKDVIRDEYYNRFVLWPFFQWTDKHPGTEQFSSYKALPFPLYVRQDDAYSCTTHPAVAVAHLLSPLSVRAHAIQPPAPDYLRHRWPVLKS